MTALQSERYERCADLRARLDQARREGLSVGMVGTSGAMHEGHLSLVRRSVLDNDLTALFWGGRSSSEWMASQVGGRDEDRDFALLEGTGLDIIFVPEGKEMFPREPMTSVRLPAMSSDVPHLESPDHLDLIALAMAKLWNVFGPCRSYFGEKDWQQLVMFQRLAEDLAWPVEVIGCPTIRDERGLALSSRNQQLTEAQLIDAPVLYCALEATRHAACDGVRASEELARIFANVVGDVARVEYFTAVESATMRPLDQLTGSVRLLGSVQIGSVRLVDNIGLNI